MTDNVVSITGTKKPDEQEEYTIIDTRWFSNNLNGNDKPIAVVLVEDQTMHYVFAVIGTGTNTQHVAVWGTKIDRKMAEGVFGYELNDYKSYKIP